MLKFNLSKYWFVLKDLLNTPSKKIASTCLLVVIFLTFVSIYTNPEIGYLLAIILGWSFAFASIFSVSVFLSSVLGFMTYFAINIVVFAISLVTHSAVSRKILIISHLSILVLFWAIIIWRKWGHLHSPKLLGVDLIAFATFFIVLIVLLIPFQTSGSLHTLKYLSIGEDNISHFALHNSIVKNKSMLYAMTPEEAGVNINLKYYPQGYHANLAANTIIAYGNQPKLDELTKSHILQIASYYALFSGLFVYVVTSSFLRKIKISIRKYLLAISVSSVAVYFGSLGFLLYLFTYGFHTQIASYIFLLATIAVSVAPLNPKIRSYGRSFLIAITLGLSIIATSYTWYFMLPILAILSLLWLYTSRGFIKHHLLAVTLTIITIASISFVAVAFDTFRAHDTNNVLLGGAIWRPQPLIQLSGAFGLVVLILSYLSDKKRNKQNSHIYLVFSILAALLFSFLLALYMYLKLGRVEYYFYKSEYTLLLLVFASLGYSINFLLSNSTVGISSLTKNILISSFAVFCLLLCVTISPLTYTKAYISGALPTPLNTGYIDLINSDPTIKDIVIRPTCNNLSNYITQRWIQAIKLNETKEKTFMNLSHVYNNGASDIAVYDRYDAQPGVVGVESGACSPK